MNIVYKLTFTKRKQENIKPFLYIGSKSNALFEGGLIYDKNKKPYYGSSCYNDYEEIVKSDKIEVEIIKSFDNYNDALNFEFELQSELDVVADPDYFNLSIATVNNFTNPNYATYKHVNTGKTVRLPRNHHMVISGDYVGVSKGSKSTEETKKKIGRPGDKNPFYGKKHSEETKLLISQANKGRKISSERKEWFIENIAKKEKSAEQRKKMGRKNMIMLKNKTTGESIRINKSEKYDYDPEVWINPFKLSSKGPNGSKWTTNGFVNKKIEKGEEPEFGFWFGRTITSKSKGEK